MSDLVIAALSGAGIVVVFLLIAGWVLSRRVTKLLAGGGGAFPPAAARGESEEHGNSTLTYRTLEGDTVEVPAVLPARADGTCADCDHFDYEGGQLRMRDNQAFMQASQVIAPWRMGSALKTTPNPAYVELVSEIEEAQAAVEEAENVVLDAETRDGADALADAADLHAAARSRLLGLEAIQATMPPALALEPERQASEGMLACQWADFGACHHHRTLYSRKDSCEDFVPLQKLTRGRA